MRLGTYFDDYGIEEICGVKPFVLYDEGLDRPHYIREEVWENASDNFSHVYFIPSTGHCVWTNGPDEHIRLTTMDSSENICLGIIFDEMNEAEKEQFLSNYDKFKHLFKGT